VTELVWELKKEGLPFSDGILQIDEFVDELMKLYQKKS
jgi:hypothetical protein